MDTQKKTFELKIKVNYAAADNYGQSFASFASIATVVVFTMFLGQFIPAVIAFVVSVVLGVVLNKKMSASFNKVRIAAREENKRAVNETIAPYGLIAPYYDGGVGNFDRLTFSDKETDEMFYSAAGHVNGDMVTIVIAND